MKQSEKAARKRVRRDRRREILEEATNLFGEYGFRGTTLSMVSDAVGLTEPGVLHYFPSKVDLLLGVLNFRDQKYIEKYAVLIESERADVGDFFQTLENVYVADEHFLDLLQLFIVLVGESIRSGHPSHDYFVDRYRRAREIYVRQFLALRKANLRADVDLEEVATLIMAVTDGLHIQWLLDAESVNFAGTFRLFTRIMVAYLAD